MNRTRLSPRWAFVGGASLALALGSWACADPHGVLITVSNTVSPQHPSTTIDLWAYFQPDFYAFAGAAFDVLASPDAGDFSDPTIFLTGPGQQTGMIAPDGDSVLGAITGQLQFPDANIFADRANPILHWRVTWTTNDFTARRVDVVTLTRLYGLYLDVWGNSINAYDETFTEGLGTINVIPAPAPGAPALGVAFAFRRRR
jgi:hypothetical protein